MSGSSPALSGALQELISQSGYSYRELSVVLGLSIGSISQVVQGKRRLTRDAVIAFAVACGCRLHEVDALLRLAQYPALMGDGPASLPVASRPARPHAAPSRNSAFASLGTRPIQLDRPTGVNKPSIRQRTGTPATSADISRT